MTVSAGERRTPISTVSGLRKTQAASRSISGGKVAENNSVCRSRRNFFNDATHVGKKTHVEHAIDFIEHQNLMSRKLQRAVVRDRSSSRPGVATTMSTPRLQLFRLLSVADTAVMTVTAQIGKPPVVAKCGLDLRREFARRLQHETANVSVLRELRQIGSANAAVLPVPVWAVPIRSFPARTIGKCAQLNRRRLGETHRLGPANHFRRKTKIFK